MKKAKLTWQRSLDSNGNVKTDNNSSCPFLFQGQYYDEEIELAYNRFRYYSPEDGRYISQDPIGLEGGMPNFYSYVSDSNSSIDPFGLETIPLPDNGTAYLIKTTNNQGGPHYKVITSEGQLKHLGEDGGKVYIIEKNTKVVYLKTGDEIAEIKVKKGRTGNLASKYKGKSYALGKWIVFHLLRNI